LPLLATEEAEQLLLAGGAGEPAAQVALVPQLIARRAAAEPTAPAVVAADGRAALSYGELERRAGRLARHLRARGLGREQVAGVISTSGSTGRPKGVMVSHAALAGYVASVLADHGIAPGDRVLQFASISFDTSAEEIFPTLAAGGALVLRDDAMLAAPAVFL